MGHSRRRGLCPRAALVFVAWWLSACATTPPVSTVAPPPAWPARAAEIARLDAWDVQARVGIRAGDEGGSVGWHWQRRVDGQRLDFTGPTGKLLFRLDDDASGARAQDADGKHYAARDTESLLYELTGWRLPVAGLQFWARGLPIPEVAHTARFDPQARLIELQQAGWSLNYGDYVRVGALELPRKLELSTAANGDKPIRIKLVVREWLINATAPATPARGTGSNADAAQR